MNRAFVTHAPRAMVLVLSMLLGVFAVSTQAHAQGQSWLPDRQYDQGPGIRVGELELHPGIALRSGYDSNVFRTVNNKAFPRTGSGVLAISPHLNISTETQQRRQGGEDPGGQSRPIEFTAGLSATYFEYLKAAARPRGVNLNADVTSLLKIFPGRAVNVEVQGDYGRYTRPFTNKVTGGKNYASNLINPGLRVNMGSASKIFNTYLGYAPKITIFEGAYGLASNKSAFTFLTNYNHQVQAGASWKFLPHSALVFDGEVGMQRYNAGTMTNSTATTLVSNNNRFLGRVGFNGALTERINLTAMVGYTLLAFENQHLSDYQNAIGLAELGYRLGQSGDVAVGYSGTVVPSAIGGWMRTDRGYARFEKTFWGAFLAGMEGGVGHAAYGRMLGPGNSSTTACPPQGPCYTALGIGPNGTHREDIRVDAAARSEYRLTNWLALMVDFTVFTTLTDFKYKQVSGLEATATSRPTLTPGIAYPYPAQFLDFQVYGGVRAHY